jgi:peptidoglycan-associated lipoprotein
MKGYAAGVVVVMSCGMLFASGCAKHGVVKQEEALAPSASAAAKPAPEADVAASQPVKKSSPKEGVAQDALAPIPRGGELKATLEKIYFDFDSATLSEAARASLAKNAALVKKDPAEKVRIEGNCDERGSDEYNIALGEKRAKAAMAYLVTMGVPPNRLSVLSYGKERPADPGHDETAWSKNRRDEFVVTSY